jgi:hypothetical protein
VSAQTYNFSFSEGLDSVSGSFFVTGTSVYAIQGNVVWPQPAPGNPGGAGAFLLTPTTGSFINTSNFDITVFVAPSGGDLDQLTVNSGSLGSDIEDEVTHKVITGTASVQAAPAPVPGSGPLSYLALGLGGLFINRKRLWRAIVMTLGIAASNVNM